jgi:hypothetical protein
LIVIAAGFENVVVPQGVGVGEGVGVGLGVGVGVGVGVGGGVGVIPGLRVGVGVGVALKVVSVFTYRSNALNVPFAFVPSQFELSAQTV